ncbi:MAG: hypothetical protein JWM41_3394 [Gemmatimonadetes bacterium]|nr:hypothetical protein [Gemmatimonadota bacterium]
MFLNPNDDCWRRVAANGHANERGELIPKAAFVCYEFSLIARGNLT